MTTRRRRSTSAAWAAAHEATAKADALRTTRQLEADKAEAQARSRRARQLAGSAEAYRNKIATRAQELRALAVPRKENN